MFCRELLESLRAEFARREAAVGHVKLLVATDHGKCVANLTRTDGEVALRGRPGSQDRQAAAVLNARVQLPPADLEALVRERLAACHAGVTATILDLRCLAPGRPAPNHRYKRIV